MAYNEDLHTLVTCKHFDVSLLYLCYVECMLHKKNLNMVALHI